jgi:hypothetical protein
MIDLPGYAPSGPLGCNTGGPMSRNRTERIRSTLLGDRTRHGYWSSVEVVVLPRPEGLTLRDWCFGLLEEAGFASAEEARRHIDVPRSVMAVARGDTMLSKFRASNISNDPQACLRAAVILGSCSETFYDPDRSIIWTDRVLGRQVTLNSVGDFYGD